MRRAFLGKVARHLSPLRPFQPFCSLRPSHQLISISTHLSSTELLLCSNRLGIPRASPSLCLRAVRALSEEMTSRTDTEVAALSTRVSAILCELEASSAHEELTTSLERSGFSLADVVVPVANHRASAAALRVVQPSVAAPVLTKPASSASSVESSLASLFQDISAFEIDALHSSPRWREWLAAKRLLVPIEDAVQCMPPCVVGDLQEVRGG